MSQWILSYIQIILMHSPDSRHPRSMRWPLKFSRSPTSLDSPRLMSIDNLYSCQSGSSQYSTQCVEASI